VIRFKTQLVKPCICKIYPWWREIWN
jgi:hypothetical protein